MLLSLRQGDFKMGQYTAKQTVLIVAFVLIFLFSLAFVFNQYLRPYLESSSSTPTSESKEITISYTALKKNTIIWSGGFGSYSEQPDLDKVFLEVNITISNNGYDSFSTNPFYFYAIADNIKYNHDFNTYNLNMWETVDVLDGGTFHGTLVFQIPESASSFTLGYEVYFITYDIVWNKM